MKDIRIEQWKPEYTEAFVRLNTEWIEKYFWIEDEDRKLFADPKAEIIDTGGMIYYAVTSDGVVVGCGALLKDPYGNYEKLGFHKVETESQLFERGDYFLEMPLD